MNSRLKSKARGQLLALVARKSLIERSIDEEMRKRVPCSLTLQQLKRLRLRLKDHLEGLRFWLDDRNFNRG